MAAGSDTPHMKTMRETCLLLMNGMMPQDRGGGHAGPLRALAEAVERAVVEEELRHEEARPGVLLGLEAPQVGVEALAGDVALGVGGGADAEPGVDEGGDQLRRAGEVAGRRAGDRVAAQREDVLDPRPSELLDLLLESGAGHALAGEMRDRRDGVHVLNHRRHLGRGAGVAAAACGVGYADEGRLEPGELPGDAGGVLARKLAFRGEDLERDGLRPG